MCECGKGCAISLVWSRFSMMVLSFSYEQHFPGGRKDIFCHSPCGSLGPLPFPSCLKPSSHLSQQLVGFLKWICMFVFCFLFTSSLLNFKSPTPPHFFCLFSQFKAGKELKEKYYLIFLQVNPLIIYLHLFIVCGFFIKKKSPLVFPFSFVKRNLFAVSLLDPLGPEGASASPRTPKGPVSPLPKGLGADESGGPPSPQGHRMALR